MTNRYIPENSTHLAYEDIKYNIYTYNKVDGTPVALYYGGRRKKPDQHYRYDNELIRQNAINTFVKGKREILEQRNNDKIAKKLQEDEAFKEIKVGDVFHQGGGYDQTNCSFYQLISLKGKTGTFRSIRQDSVDGTQSYMSEQRIPLKDDFIGKEMKLRITGDRIKPGYDRAYKCEPGQSFYCSWYA